MTNSFKDYMARRQSAGAVVADAAIATGLPVFPCGPDKKPMVAHGYKDASTDPVIVRRMFGSAACLIGCPTGEATGFVVVDVDIKENRQGGDWLNANSHRMPQTHTIRTGSGGLHLYFKHPGQRVKNQNDKIAPGIDVRGDGGYVIVPPSAGYQVADDAPMADLPDWLLPVLCPPEPVHVPAPVVRSAPLTGGGTPYGLAALSNECDAIRRAGFGQQESTLNASGLKIGALVAGGELEEGAALSELMAAARGISSQPGKAPWSVSQLESKARRAFSDGKASPRSAPPEPPIEIDTHPAAAMLAKMRANVAKRSAKPAPVTADIMDVDGILKMLVDACIVTAIRPQPFLALGAAICAVGALAGRQYRTATDLRTNVYIGAICESGGGKDHAPEIIRRCFDAAGLERYLGGETLASGRAILSSLENHPVRLFQVDEFGMFLTTITGQKAAPHKAEIWSELMKLYSRAKGVYRGTEYANKKDNPRIDINQPCVCFYGTTTPSTFWAALKGGAMSDGSLARFLTFITPDDRPERNKNSGIFTPPDELLAALRAVSRGQGAVLPTGNLPAPFTAPMSATVAAEPYTVPMFPEAEALHEAKLVEEDEWAKKVAGTPQAAIVNRLAENAMKLALISAVSRRPQDPRITERDVSWGWAVAMHCTRALLNEAERFIADTEFEAKMNKAKEIIRKNGPCSARDMFRCGFKLAERERREVIGTLLENGIIVATETQPSGAGRPSIKYTLATIGYENGEGE
jgi:hypothetical protein